MKLKIILLIVILFSSQCFGIRCYLYGKCPKDQCCTLRHGCKSLGNVGDICGSRDVCLCKSGLYCNSGKCTIKKNF